MKEITMFRTREVTLRAPETPLLLHLDGELRAPGRQECTISVVAAALNVLVAR